MAEESTNNVSPRDLERLVLFLERYPMVALTSFRSRNISLRYQFLWDRFAANVNSQDESMKKSGKAWSKYWSQWKLEIRRKYLYHQRYLAAGEESPIEFSPYEQRLLKLLTDNHGQLLPPLLCQRRTGYSGMNNNNIDFESRLPNNNSAIYIYEHVKEELRPRKTIEELRKELVEFELKKQKELHEIEKRQKIEKHDMDMAILELRRKLLAKELDKT